MTDAVILSELTLSSDELSHSQTMNKPHLPDELCNMIIYLAIERICQTPSSNKWPWALTMDTLDSAVSLTDLRAKWLNVHAILTVFPSSFTQTRCQLEHRCHEGQEAWSQLKKRMNEHYGDNHETLVPRPRYTLEERYEKDDIWTQYAVDLALLKLMQMGRGPKGSKRRQRF